MAIDAKDNVWVLHRPRTLKPGDAAKAAPPVIVFDTAGNYVKAWGGAGRDYVSYALALEAIAKASATVAVSLSVTNSLVAELVAHAGRDPQRELWLRRLAAGDAIGAFALSEPDAGTDAANQKTTALSTEEGYRIRGRKVWVANAEEADLAIVFAATRPGRSATCSDARA